MECLILQENLPNHIGLNLTKSAMEASILRAESSSKVACLFEQNLQCTRLLKSPMQQQYMTEADAAQGTPLFVAHTTAIAKAGRVPQAQRVQELQLMQRSRKVRKWKWKTNFSAHFTADLNAETNCTPKTVPAQM